MMNSTIVATIIGVLMLVIGAHGRASAEPGRGEPGRGEQRSAESHPVAADEAWVRLAERPVGRGLETAAIEVGATAGAFGRLRLSADGADVLVEELRVYFLDGAMQRVVRQESVSRKVRSAIHDLEGGLRRIARIEVTFKRLPSISGRAAMLSVWAEAASVTTADRQAPNAQAFAHDPVNPVARDPADNATPNAAEVGWELLGKESVGTNVAQSVIPVGRSEGRFEALRLQVHRSDVAFHDIRVVYLNGEVDTLAVRRLIKAGDESPPLTLKGDARYIRAIELVHEANPEVRDPAIVEIWGRRSPISRQ